MGSLIIVLSLSLSLSLSDQGDTDQEAVSRYCQDSTETVQVITEAVIIYPAQGETQRCAAAD